MNQQINAKNVTLVDLWDIFKHRLVVILLAAIVAVCGLFLYIHATFIPEYKSTATLYILRQNESDSVGYNSSDDFSLALKVVSDCDYLLKSHSVLDEVIKELNLDISYRDLNKSVSITNPENTRILEVTVISSSPEEAKRIVDSICRIGTEKIEQAMGFSQVNLYEYGIINQEACNRTGIMTYILVGAIVVVLTYLVFLVAFLLDDRIRKDEDIEWYLGLSVLGDIPNANESKKHHYGYYSAVYGAHGREKSEERYEG